ncbi:MAG: UUP1 family membrane protein [bacterium]
MRNRWVWTLSVLLFSAGIAICAIKVKTLGLPLTPDQDTAVWTVEARASFRGRGGPLQARLFIPHEPPAFEILDEDFVSQGYGIATETEGLDRLAIWTVRRASGPQALYYRLSVVPDEGALRHEDPFPGFPQKPVRAAALDSAVETLLQEVRLESADIESFARALIQRLHGPARSGAVEMLRDAAATPADRAAQIVDALAGARIPARIVWGIQLDDGIREGRLEPWIEVHNEQEWLPFDPMSGKPGYPARFLVWKIGAEPLFELEGGRSGEVRFAVARSMREVVDVAAQRARSQPSFWMDFSLFSLPIQTQNLYKILLTVPLGAFLVVLMRTFVGVQTFGTFMPILIALAFRETRLFWGLFLFVSIVGLGLGIRFALDRLQLLLVPRLTTVLIVVILIMLAISISTFQLGMDRGLSVALFPMVILAMTIERMSLVWEEMGGREAVHQGGGSLLVAALGYLVITDEWLSHLVFVFPELLLVVLGATILAGRYTGYRMSELWRFRSLWMKGGGAP